MNGELWAPRKPSFTKPYCDKRGSAAMKPTIPSYSWDKDEETEHSKNKQNTKEQQLFLKTRVGNIRSNGKHTTPRDDEGYCNKATQSGPLTHSQSHQAQNAAEHTEVKKRAWTLKEIREVVWCYTDCSTPHSSTKASGIRATSSCGKTPHATPLYIHRVAHTLLIRADKTLQIVVRG